MLHLYQEILKVIYSWPVTSMHYTYKSIQNRRITLVLFYLFLGNCDSIMIMTVRSVSPFYVYFRISLIRRDNA